MSPLPSHTESGRFDDFLTLCQQVAESGKGKQNRRGHPLADWCQGDKRSLSIEPDPIDFEGGNGYIVLAVMRRIL